MRARWLSLSLLLAFASATPQVLAEGKSDKKSSSSETSSKKKGNKPDSDGVRRDPQGITGVSPLTEALPKGDSAYASKDWDGAAAAYRDAINKDTKDPVGHYRLGEALLAGGKLEEADQAWQAALKAATATNDEVMKAKALFVIADLRERQGKLEEASAAWKEYAAFVGAHSKAKGHPNTPTERQKAIDTHNDVAAKAAKVKERIRQREQEAQQQASTPPKKK